MARLQRLTLKHFKSFKSATIPLSEGFTAIMGPNGSGKSNIIDALIFVLGEGRLRIVRANRLKDLVNIKAKDGEAVVSIDIEHEGKTYNISRSINRAGNSIYRINGKRVTRNEVISLLSSMGISQRGYNFVLQGEVTRLIKMTPQERRQIIDEMAGVSDYEQKKEEALQKLDVVSQRIREASILLGEREEILSRLEREKNDALRYMELKKEINNLKKSLLKKQREELRSRLNGEERELKRLEELLTDIEGRIRNIEEELREKEKKVRDLTDKITEIYASSGEGELNSIINAVEGVLREIEDLERKKEEMAAELTSLEIKEQELEEEILRLRKELEEITSKRREKAEEVNALRSRLSSIEDAIKKEKTEASSIKMRMEELEQAIEELKGKYSSLKEGYGRVVGEYNTKLSVVEKQKKRWDELRKKKSNIEKELNDLEEKKRTIVEREKSLNAEYQRLQEEIKSIREELAELKGMSVALRNMGVSLELVETLLEAQRRGELRGIKGYVASLISYDPKYRRAIEAAAGRRLFYIVVETFNDAVEAINYLKRMGMGRATFIPLDRIKPHLADVPKREGVLGRALDLVRYDPTLERAMRYVFGDTIVVDTLERAKGIEDVRVVTLEGDVVERSGVLTGGSVKGESVLKVFESERKRIRLKELEEEARSIVRELEQVRKEFEDISSRISKLYAEKSHIEEELSSSQEEDLSKLKERLESMEKELTSIVNRLSDLEQERALLLRRARKLEEGELFEEYSRLRREYEAKLRELSEYDAIITEKRQKLSYLEESVAELRKKKEDNKITIARIEERLKQLKEELSSLEEKRKMLEDKVSSAKNELKDMLEERDRLEGEIRELSRELGRLREEKNVHEKELIEVKARIASIRTRLEEVERSFEEQEGEVVPLPPNPDDTLREKEEQLSSLEPINMRAIEEYEEMKKLVDEIKEKIKKLEEERKAILKLIEEIEQKKREVFMDTFRGLSKQFERVYNELVGGKARLRLTEENIDKAGLIIEATPKGKTFVNMDALSGGEKAMVALSFIFATAMYKPSPFYVLDEPDLMLDKVNAERMAKYIRKLSKNAQFILVSHRDVVLKEADQIIGVYLGRDGSSLIEVRVPSRGS